LSHHRNTTCFRVGLLQGPHCPCMETWARLPRSECQSEWHIYNLSLK
jgi:hypothetical protein